MRSSSSRLRCTQTGMAGQPGPALYDSSRAYGFALNYIAIGLLVAVIGALVVWLWPTSNRQARSPRAVLQDAHR